MDNSQALQKLVREAYVNKLPLSIKGGGTKDFYGLKVDAEPLDVTSHEGIVSHERDELILTARAGTPFNKITQYLAQHGQMLSCEAPSFGENATFGGVLAAGLSGPRRPFGGSISDLLLGCKILNGRGQILQFGGKVMKNVAGYDNSRLMVGSMGCLGIILEATVKVVPAFKAEQSFRFDIEQEKMTAFINKLTGLGYPVSATAYEKNGLVIRFSAGANEIAELEKKLRGDFDFIEFKEEVLANFWIDLREQHLEFFNDRRNLWRISTAPGAPALDLDGDTLLEFNGAQRWVKTDLGSRIVFARVARDKGTATLFKANNQQNEKQIFQTLSAPLMQWQHNLKKAFDPAGIFNPGRMYSEL